MCADLPENLSNSLEDDQKQPVHIPHQFRGQGTSGTARSNDKDASERSILHERQVIPPPSLHNAPAEILSEIFILAIPTRKLEIDAGSPVEEESDYEIKFALSQVCSYWRIVALATPQIWSSIPVVSTDRLESERLIALTKMFIERSRSTPLHITIILPEMQPRETKEWCDVSPLLLHLIFSHAYRWKTAIIHIHDNNVKLFPVQDLPILESLNYKRISLIFPRYFSEVRTIGHTPSLRRVILHGLESQLHLPWSQLWDYTGFPPNLGTIEPASPQLGTCVLIGPLCVQEYPETPMVFSQLTSLKIINSYRTFLPFRPEDDDKTVFRSIATPVLENLKICATSKLNDASFVVAELHLTMLLCPSITLRSISFHVMGMTKEDLKKVLYSTPCLTTLDICDTPASVFACLYAGAAQTLSGFMEPLTPRLQSLTIHDFSHSDAAALLAVYDSRHPPLITAQDNTKVAHLDIIFTYRSFRACRQAQCRIAQGDGVNIKALKKILGRCDHLVKQFLVEFPDKERKYAVPGNKQSPRRMYTAKELDSFFMDVMETADQFSDPVIVELSRITRILSDIRDLPPTAILDDNNYEFRKRAGRVLDGLVPLLQDLAPRRWWTLGDDHLTLRAWGREN